MSRSSLSGLAETEVECLQKDVDNYTRKLEQEKRKLFSIQDTYRVVMQQYHKEKE